ncbi:alpha/beta hydrolase [Streptomyces tubercidicus]|uniref:Thioesterase n=1 Tax=Streptomyces tubercidicus TaxID=47759 RepID=A0A640UXT5_9ACTN|nr:alpha/beta hydrolase [Streptomyces tubercidicus]WAU14485.1 alpha/beta fold hydrolase [Streptomyces tubercidicus]GFE40224.1 thioesterase [Streptomyces tubercidicus]
MNTDAAVAAAGSLSPGVRAITLDGGVGGALSALIAEPEGTPRATVVAVHGGGMRAGYFDGQSHPDVSLLTLGARLGYTVVAVDRPGYGLSAGRLPQGQTLAEQSVTMRTVLADVLANRPTGAGLFLLAHSYGGKLAFTCAADPLGVPLLGLDISGCGHRYAVDPADLPDAHQHAHWTRNWGRLRLYPPHTFRDSAPLIAPMPSLDCAEAARWPQCFDELAAQVRVPVRLTFAEHETWWRHDEECVADLRARLTSAPRFTVNRLYEAGHNISLGWAARTYHLRALAFLEECVAAAG